jgi:hypothetical protein
MNRGRRLYIMFETVSLKYTIHLNVYNTTSASKFGCFIHYTEITEQLEFIPYLTPKFLIRSF